MDCAHADLDEIKRRLDRGDLAAADVLANRVRCRAWSDLSDGQRWRLCTLHADAKLRLYQNTDAAKLILEALSYAPNSVYAVTNAIHALRTSDDSAGARQKS